MAQSNGVKGVTPFEIVGWRAFRGADSGAATQAVAWRYEPSPGILLSHACRRRFDTALWLRDYARLDLRLTPDGRVWLLEANANPFISYGHDMANAAAKAGKDYGDFIQRIVDAAVTRYERS